MHFLLVFILVLHSTQNKLCFPSRYHCIRNNVRLITLSVARYSLSAVWLAGFILAVVPVLKYSPEHGFYSSNGLCFPLHIDDPFLVGWQYSAFVFFGINFSAVSLQILSSIIPLLPKVARILVMNLWDPTLQKYIWLMEFIKFLKVSFDSSKTQNSF